PLPDSSGVLLASGERHADGTPFQAKGFTYSSRKWAHLNEPDHVLVRGSVGRFGESAVLQRDDADLVAAVRADLAELTGVTATPLDSVVTRWGGGLPQYGVGHLDLVATIERAVAALPGLAVAGAALHGVGLPACVASADKAARRLSRLSHPVR
ncbi:MAG TPA: protoporphyrinogen oxidase, partial [Pseudonocardiaceae bacterium]